MCAAAVNRLTCVLPFAVTEVAEFCACDTVAIDVFRHGRRALPGAPDVTRTVGWLAGVVPHVLTVGSADSLGRQIQHIQDIEPAWGPVRYLVPDGPLAALPRPLVYLHFRGRGLHELPTSDLFRRADAYLGVSKNPANATFAHLEIRADVVNDRLCLDWSFSPRMFTANRIRALATDCVARLADLTEETS